MSIIKIYRHFRLAILVMLIFVICSIPARAQSETNPIHPSMYLRHSAGIYATQYLGLGSSYRYRSPKGLGVHVSYSPKFIKNIDLETIELAALYTLTARTVERYWLRGTKSYNIYIYLNNVTSLVDNKLSLSNSISLGFEEVHWRHVAINVLLGYIIRPSTNFPFAVGFGAYYKF